MKAIEVMEILDAEVLCGENLLDKEVSYAFSCDLMSDVLAFVNGETLLLTGLVNQQVVRTVEMADLNVIVFVRGKKPGNDVVELAKQNNLILLCTRDTMYTASGKLYAKGLFGLTI